MTPRLQQFVNAYLGEANGNATSAAKSVGCSDKSAGVLGSRWLKRTDVQQALKQRLQKADLRTQARLEKLAIIADTTPQRTTASDVIKANELILRVNGALKDNQQDSRITVNIGFLTPPSSATPAAAFDVQVMPSPPRISASAPFGVPQPGEDS